MKTQVFQVGIMNKSRIPFLIDPHYKNLFVGYIYYDAHLLYGVLEMGFTHNELDQMIDHLFVDYNNNFPSYLGTITKNYSMKKHTLIDGLIFISVLSKRFYDKDVQRIKAPKSVNKTYYKYLESFIPTNPATIPVNP